MMYDCKMIIKPVDEISNNVVCATSKASDQPAHTRSLIRAFASRLSILWLLSYWLNTIWSFLAENEAAEARLSLHLSKYHIVGNHMSRLNYIISLPDNFYPTYYLLTSVSQMRQFVWTTARRSMVSRGVRRSGLEVVGQPSRQLTKTIYDRRICNACCQLGLYPWGHCISSLGPDLWMIPEL